MRNAWFSFQNKKKKQKKKKEKVVITLLYAKAFLFYLNQL